MLNVFNYDNAIGVPHRLMYVDYSSSNIFNVLENDDSVLNYDDVFNVDNRNNDGNVFLNNDTPVLNVDDTETVFSDHAYSCDIVNSSVFNIDNSEVSVLNINSSCYNDDYNDCILNADTDKCSGFSNDNVINSFNNDIYPMEVDKSKSF